jgi:hypothetical protein
MRTSQGQIASGQAWHLSGSAELDSVNTLLLAFVDAPLEAVSDHIAGLRQAWPKAVVMGCSTSGSISGAEVLESGAALAAVRFDRTQLRYAWAPLSDPSQSGAAGASLAQQLSADDLSAVFVLSDGICSNGTALVQGLVGGLRPGVTVTGGLAGDGPRFGSTWVLHDGAPRAGVACAVGLYGDHIQVGHGCSGGWSDFGPERRVTRSEGNVLYELDGQPALDLYRTYLGDRAAGLPGTALLFPLAIRRPEEPDAEPLVRTILGIDEDRRSMTFAGDIPQGSIARLMRASTDKLVDSAGQAGRAASVHLPDDPQALVLAVSCVGRRLVLGERTEEEVEMVRESMPGRATQLGFYSYGEISPALPNGMADLHNQTMTVTVFHER